MKSSFENMYHDQEKLQGLLSAIRSTNRVQGMIFGGVKGIGKALAAKELAQSLLSTSGNISENLSWIEPSGDIITVDQVREIKKFLCHTVQNNLYRIIVIDDADRLNMSAANALLKMLEEPPLQTLFILISHQPYKLIKTIRSRCMMVHFSVPKNSHEIVCKHLSMEKKEIETLERLSRNIPGLSIAMGKAGALDLYKKLTESLSNKHDAYKLCEEYFAHSSLEKWQVFVYLMQYLIEKVIRCHVNNFHNCKLYGDQSEKQAIDNLVKTYPVQHLFFVYNELLKYAPATIRSHLDHKTVAITLLGYIT